MIDSCEANRVRLPRNVRARPTKLEAQMCKATKQEWKNVKGSWISVRPVSPGIWRRKEGGHVVRARAVDPATGRTREVWKALRNADKDAAQRWWLETKARISASTLPDRSPRMRFAEFAAQLFEDKVKAGDIKSAAGRNKWVYTLKHLVSAFGAHYMDRLHAEHVAAWRRAQAERVATKQYAPTTVNGWIFSTTPEWTSPRGIAVPMRNAPKTA